MTIQERIQNDLKESIKSRDKDKTSYLKVIVGELQRLPDKELKDNQVVRVIKKLIEYEKENAERSKLDGSEYLDLLESYIPEQISSGEIEKWIKENIDFSQYKNKMQAMKPIMAHFGTGADGKIVKSILEKNIMKKLESPGVLYKGISMVRMAPPVEDNIIFNYNPTKKDIEKAFNEDKIIVCNCINRKDINSIIDVIDSIPKEWKNNVAVYYWPMKKEEFERAIRERLFLEPGSDEFK